MAPTPEKLSIGVLSCVNDQHESLDAVSFRLQDAAESHLGDFFLHFSNSSHVEYLASSLLH